MIQLIELTTKLALIVFYIFILVCFIGYRLKAWQKKSHFQVKAEL